MSFPQEERNKIMTTIHEDVQFLESINLTNYSLIVAITQRTIETSLQLPGKLYFVFLFVFLYIFDFFLLLNS
jgi:hypothetical protein